MSYGLPRANRAAQRGGERGAERGADSCRDAATIARSVRCVRLLPEAGLTMPPRRRRASSTRMGRSQPLHAAPPLLRMQLTLIPPLVPVLAATPTPFASATPTPVPTPERHARA